MKTKVSVLFMMAGILFATCLLISNILASKILMIGTWSAPAGVLIFPVTYILNDVITEVWGFSKARLIIWMGFGMNLLAILFFSAAIALPSAPFWHEQEAYSSVLGNTTRIAVASLSAYLIGSFLNSIVMSRMKVKTAGKYFSMRAIFSTLVGEGADSLLFITIAFTGIYPIQTILIMILTQALLKTAYEIIILPLTIQVVRFVKRHEGIDTYDTGISYKLFNVNDL
jgi:queuosine precursor transporter